MLDTDLIGPELDKKVTAWRQTIHANPEMAFKEKDTSRLVTEQLRALGYDVKTGIAQTGVVGTLHFGPGPSIALRADMDALPIEEASDLPYKSSNNGCMHACGHDGHTAIMLGVATSLAKRDDLSGTLHIIFQPAEENEGGARAMLEAGFLDDYEIDSIYALHNYPGLPIGQMQVMSGPMLASFDKFDIEVLGQGGHGAFPESCQDSILIASQLVMALNNIVSRDVPPQSPAVLTIGSFKADGAYNVIPNQVLIQGSCRALCEDTRQTIRGRILDICEGLSLSYGVKITCDYQDGYPILINHEGPTKTAIEALNTVVPSSHVETEFDPIMGSEDFAFFLQKIPGCYFLLGNGDSSPVHTDTYNYNDDASKYGIATFVKIVERELGEK